MIETKAIARRWGNSIGIAFPKEIIRKAKIKPNQEMTIYLPEKAAPISSVFGTLRIKQPTQQILDKIRKGEE